MNWFWKVRIYNNGGCYGHAQIITGRALREIDTIQDFYKTLTGCKMLLEGMSEHEFEGVNTIQKTFDVLWESRQ